MEAGPVVVIDDEPELLNMVCDALAIGGIETICLGDPDEARSLDDSVQPKLFLVDVMLPGMSGVELARELRAEGYPDTPMVAMSASSTMLKDAAASNLFRSTISKPFDLLELLDTVERYLSEHRSSSPRSANHVRQPNVASWSWTTSA